MIRANARRLDGRHSVHHVDRPTIEFPDQRSVQSSTDIRQRRWRHLRRALLACVLFALLSGRVSAQSLRGSASSLDLQTDQAERHNFTYLRGTAQVRQFVDAGLLVPVDGNLDYTLKDVSFPFARPEVKLFVERISRQYHRACGARLVVTSLTRPQSHQPRNASERSVHPTGMALDLRRPEGTCRQWLERTLLSLEDQGVLEATAERSPPHLHVAVFPSRYSVYVDRLTARAAGGAMASGVYTVRRGDTLWGIAERHGTSVRSLTRANRLTSARILVGQALRIP